MDLSSLSDDHRLAAIRRSGLLNAAMDADFDRLAKLAAQLVSAPAAFVTIIDDERQHIKSVAGEADVKPGDDMTLDRSFCRFAVASREPLLIEDSRLNELVKDLPPTKEGIIAYAGVPLFGAEGEALGALCVVDSKPRRWSSEDVENLQVLSRSATALLERRREQQRNEAKLEPSLTDRVADHLGAVTQYNRIVAAEDHAFDIGRENIARLAVTETFEALENAFSAAQAQGEEVDSELGIAVARYLTAQRDRDELHAAFRRGGASLAQLEDAISDHMAAIERLRMAALDSGN
jgi:GAF domain-containing protein